MASTSGSQKQNNLKWSEMLAIHLNTHPHPITRKCANQYPARGESWPSELSRRASLVRGGAAPGWRRLTNCPEMGRFAFPFTHISLSITQLTLKKECSVPRGSRGGGSGGGVVDGRSRRPASPAHPRKSHPDRINIDPAKYSCETRAANFGFGRMNWRGKVGRCYKSADDTASRKFLGL